MFFDQRYEKGLPWYVWHYQNSQAGQTLGEIAPTYFSSTKASERCRSHFPDLKVIINVRDPITKAHSLFRHHYSKGRTKGSFEDALANMPELIDSGRYATHAKRWLETFGSEQVLFVVQEDVKKTPQSVIDEVCKFLAIEPISLDQEKAAKQVNSATAPRSVMLAWLLSNSATRLRSLRLHKLVNLAKALGIKKAFSGGKPVPEMPEETKTQLANTFAEDILWLERTLQRDFSSWRPSND